MERTRPEADQVSSGLKGPSSRLGRDIIGLNGAALASAFRSVKVKACPQLNGPPRPLSSHPPTRRLLGAAPDLSTSAIPSSKARWRHFQPSFRPLSRQPRVVHLLLQH
jgi:hypothetical protein